MVWDVTLCSGASKPQSTIPRRIQEPTTKALRSHKETQKLHRGLGVTLCDLSAFVVNERQPPNERINESQSGFFFKLKDSNSNHVIEVFHIEDEPWYFAEVVEGSELVLQSDEMPRWFKPIWDQLYNVEAPE